VTLGASDNLLQHRSRRGKVRRGPSEEEKAARRELTEGGGGALHDSGLAVALRSPAVGRR
jgi:hypothetical protein